MLRQKRLAFEGPLGKDSKNFNEEKKGSAGSSAARSRIQMRRNARLILIGRRFVE